MAKGSAFVPLSAEAYVEKLIEGLLIAHAHGLGPDDVVPIFEYRDKVTSKGGRTSWDNPDNFPIGRAVRVRQSYSAIEAEDGSRLLNQFEGEVLAYDREFAYAHYVGSVGSVFDAKPAEEKPGQPIVRITVGVPVKELARALQDLVDFPPKKFAGHDYMHAIVEEMVEVGVLSRAIPSAAIDENLLAATGQESHRGDSLVQSVVETVQNMSRVLTH
jgi:hypothetical protein